MKVNKSQEKTSPKPKMWEKQSCSAASPCKSLIRDTLPGFWLLHHNICPNMGEAAPLALSHIYKLLLKGHTCSEILKHAHALTLKVYMTTSRCGSQHCSNWAETLQTWMELISMGSSGCSAWKECWWKYKSTKGERRIKTKNKPARDFYLVLTQSNQSDNL